MPQFIDTRDAVVTQAIDGGLRTAPHTARLDGYPHIRVVVRTDFDRSKVALVSGGGSGHEPAHAGFVGAGMLTAAVCGDVFASPSVEAVLAGILAVTGKGDEGGGCLLIVKNYTGDRLNFGLAAERAKALGRAVEMVVVADDVALPDIAQPRGVAGTLFVHKIAGALAESGASLDEVARVAREVADAAKSYGVALDTCTLPGADKEARIPEGQAELGLGIHGEPGVEQVPFTNATDITATVMRALADHADGPQVALLNDLGSTTPLELSIVTQAVLDGPVAITHAVGPARLMTSLDMHGFSVSCLPARSEWVEALQASTAAPGWPGVADVRAVETVPMPDGLEPQAFEPSEDAELRALVERACDALEGMRADLDRLDGKVGDGDTGSTVAGAARAVREALPLMPLADLEQAFRALSDTLSRTMGGSSGVLLAILFAGAADAARDGADVVAALRAGLQRMMEYGGAEPGHRTMVDALHPALDALASDGLPAAARAARTGADATARMDRARSGRSAYLSADALEGAVDPGAEAVARLFEVLAEG